MESYDVIIVGAGPAGLNCAAKLAEANLKVLLVEKKGIIGPKVCAGALTRKDVDYLKLPDSLLDYKYQEIIFHTLHSETLVRADDYLFYTVDRKNLGQWQAEKLKRTDTVIKVNAKVTGIENKSVIINKSEIFKFKYLVGADGSLSIVRRHLGIKSEEVGIAIQYKIATQKYRDFEIFYNSKLFHSWYAWIFPHRGYVSIGCGCDPRFLSSGRLKENFKRWLHDNRIDVSKGEYQAYPINVDFRGYKFGNIFLVGDAAGLASGFTGEGIYQALISGEEVAKMIINESPGSSKMDELIETKKLHNRVLHVLEKSGPLRVLEYEFVALLLRNRRMRQKVLNVVV